MGGPKRIADLGIRQWTCSDCGALHDGDVNAARNLLLFAGAERRPLAGEIPALRGGEDVKSRPPARSSTRSRQRTGR
ncbi:MAG: hypothetical protein JO283_16910 [Bradyrhizobium sp.]|nr:hypothetical protein [Bradyrhizobium sp.]